MMANEHKVITRPANSLPVRAFVRAGFERFGPLLSVRQTVRPAGMRRNATSRNDLTDRHEHPTHGNLARKRAAHRVRCVMSLGPSPIARRRRLGAELCTLRERSKLSPVELGGLLGWTETKVRRLETARVRPNVGEVMDLLDALRVTGLQREHVLDL